jgi:hypothetical protein
VGWLSAYLVIRAADEQARVGRRDDAPDPFGVAVKRLGTVAEPGGRPVSLQSQERPKGASVAHPVATSQTLIVLSRLALTRKSPEGRKRTADTE